MLRRIAADYCSQNGLVVGTYAENVAAMRLHRWGIAVVQQHRVGRYRLDFAHRDSLRDSALRALGWVILRVTAGDDEQLAKAARLVRLAADE